MIPIRSRLPFVRIILAPYLVLLLLFVTVTGAGSIWLYVKARQAQSQLVVHGLLQTVRPLIVRLSRADVPALVKDGESWLHQRIEGMFRLMPDLESVQLNAAHGGFRKFHDPAHRLVTQPLTARIARHAGDLSSQTAGRRLYSESAPLLRIAFEVDGGRSGPVYLEFGFNRAALQDAVGRAMGTMRQAISLFFMAGLACLAIAFVVTLWAAMRVRRLEAQVQELYRHASAAELMAGLVHDLRNPLASFRANLAALRITPKDTEEIVADMDQDLVRMDAKLGAMLDLTRPRDETPVPVNVDRLLDDIARQAEPALSQRGIALRRRCRIDRPVMAMADGLRDVLLNLVINSAESGQHGGEIDVEAWLENDRLVFRISDRGDGLPARTDIFAPFVSTKPSGHGLGLAISRRTVEAYGGSIKARNRPGGGAVFTVSLPQPPRKRGKDEPPG